jgi:hypothetical protein
LSEDEKFNILKEYADINMKLCGAEDIIREDSDYIKATHSKSYDKFAFRKLFNNWMSDCDNGNILAFAAFSVLVKAAADEDRADTGYNYPNYIRMIQTMDLSKVSK